MPNFEPDHSLITIEEAAMLAGVSFSSIHRATKAGALKAWDRGYRETRWLAEDVRAFRDAIRAAGGKISVAAGYARKATGRPRKVAA